MDLPWKFPDRGETLREHMRVFQGLPPDARGEAIVDTIAAGFALRRKSVREVPELLEAALRLAEAARRCGLAHALVGGLGVAFWTETRFTRQIDLLVDLPPIRLPEFLGALEEVGFTGDLPTMMREWSDYHLASLYFGTIPVEWLKPVLPACWHVLDRAVEDRRLGRPIRVASPEGLILLNLLTWDLQDQMEIGELVAACGDSLDLDWIRAEWATLADPADPRMARLAELAGGR